MKYHSWQFADFKDSVFLEFENRGVHPLVAATLASRDTSGILDENAREKLYDPFLLRDMDKAVNRVKKAIAAKEKVAVFGDYDVDGMTGVSLMVRYFHSKSMECAWLIPDRIKDGYGLNEEALHILNQKGVTLVITVDSGVTAMREALLASELGMDLIITDHHECRDELPCALAVINPMRPDCEYPFKGLAGVGVAFKLIQALEPNSRPLHIYGDLVAMGTIADVMPVTGENRTLIKAGLRMLEHTHNMGMKALIKELGLRERRMNTSLVGFSIGPKLNAAGRLGKADYAVRLLLSCDQTEAHELAVMLCEMNEERKRMEDILLKEIMARLEEEYGEGLGEARAVVLAGEQWHSGVIGIAASRLSDKLNCPVFLAGYEGGTAKGSARSMPGYNLVDILEDSSELLINYGGHAYAAGFTVNMEFFAEFKQRVLDYCGRYDKKPERTLQIDAVLRPQWITLKGAEELTVLEPYGLGNPQPIYCLEAVYITSVTQMGEGKHLRIKVESGGLFFNCVWFGVSEVPFNEGDIVDIAFRLEINRYRDEDQIQIQLTDIRAGDCANSRGKEALELYCRFESNDTLTLEEKELLRPDRQELIATWRYLMRYKDKGLVEPMELLAKNVMLSSEKVKYLGRVWIALDVFYEFGLIRLTKFNGVFSIIVHTMKEKADLSSSVILRRLKSKKD